MSQTLHEIMLRANTALFAQKMCATIEIFSGDFYEIEAKSLTKGYYRSSGTFSSFMHFSGLVQGDFIITMDTPSASEIMHKYEVPTDNTDEKNNISDFFTEILNIASGQTLPELEKKYGPLTLVPPAVVFGEIRFANVLSGIVQIRGASGTIYCTLSLNMASLRSFKNNSESNA